MALASDYDEKRDFPRMRLNAPGEFTPEGEGEAFSAQVINLSAGGALVHSEQALGVGERFTLRVGSGQPGKPMLKARIRVLRCEPREAGYDCAAEIEAMLEDDD